MIKVTDLGLNKLKLLENKIKSSMGLEIPYWYWKSEVLDFKIRVSYVRGSTKTHNKKYQNVY